MPTSITDKSNHFMKQFAFQTEVLKSKPKTKDDKKIKDLNQSKGKSKIKEDVNLKLIKGLQANKSIKNKSSS